MTRLTLAALLIAFVGASACKKETPNTASSANSSGSAATKPAPASKATRPVAPLSKSELALLLTSYEKIRALLATDTIADEIGGIADNATKLAEAARKSAGSLPKAAQHLKPIDDAAAKLAATKSSDPAAVRKQFGELSRTLVALVSTHSSLQEGLHVFKCGMAKGYQKWVQNNPKISNPYMGKKMPICGQKSDWQ